MISTAYRLLTDLGAPVIDLYLRRRLAAGREDAARFGERLGQASLPRPDGFLIWCHAASVGEAASLLALVKRLRDQHPQAGILMTTGTVTSARMLESRRPHGVIHQFMPVDRRPYVENFLAHWRPDLVVWIESELWPNMLAAVRKRRIPAVLLNGRMSEKSFRQWHRVRGWSREILGTFALCLTQTEVERERFAALGAASARCIGNLKYAAEPLPFDPAELDRLRAAAAGRDLWLMASTHRGEEAMAVSVHKQLKQNQPKLLTMIAPRHAVRGDDIAAELAGAGLAVARRSKGEPITQTTDIYLADTMGELGIFYRLAPIVAMGNSFATVGGHNPIEPAQLGGALILGPSMTNFSEITREFLDRHAALQLRHADELAAAVDRLMRDKNERDLLSHNAARLAEDKRHMLDGVMQILQPWLRPNTAA